MVKIPEQAIASTYAEFMEEVKVRLAAARESLHEAFKRHNQGERSAYLVAEFAILQVRRVTELMALSVLVAHNEIDDFRTKKLIKEWNADAMFSHLAKLSDTAFPEPFTMKGMDAEGVADILINSEGHLTKSELGSIYTSCGKQLHAGALKHMSKPKLYDLGQIQEWCRRIVRLLDHHVVMLPGNKKSMIVFMAHDPDGRVKCELRTLSRDAGQPLYVPS